MAVTIQAEGPIDSRTGWFRATFIYTTAGSTENIRTVALEIDGNVEDSITWLTPGESPGQKAVAFNCVADFDARFRDGNPHSWRIGVVGWDTDEEAWTFPRSVTFHDKNSLLLNAPTALTPEHWETDVEQPVTFTWEGGESFVGGDKFLLAYRTGAGAYTDVLVDIDTFSHQIEEIFPDGGNRRWRVGNTLVDWWDWDLINWEERYFEYVVASGDWSSEHIFYPLAGHSKPTNPTPADDATEVDWSTPTLSWSGNGDTYTVRVSKFSSFVASDIVAEDIATTEYTLTQAQKDNLTGLTDKLYWRVDSKQDGETITGDTWSFDPRPGKATTPVPFDGTTDVGLKPLLYWALPEAVDTVSAYIQREGTLEVVALLEDEEGATSYADWSDYLDHGKTYSWRVDTANEYGETEGDTWIFKTLFFDPIRASWENYPGKTLGPTGYYNESGEAVGPGVLGVDYYWTGMNAKRTTGRLVAAAASALWYEDVT